MKTTRRGFFAVLVAGIAARFAPKPAIPLGFTRLAAAFRTIPKLQFHRNALTMVYPRIGDTIKVRLPQRFIVKSGEGLFQPEEVFIERPATKEDLAEMVLD